MKTFQNCALAFAAAILVAGAGLAEPPDLETLTECSDRAWSADIASWASYAFDRHVTRRSLDKNGEATSRQELHFRVTPSGEGFDERLVEIDGRQPTAKEIKEHRDKARFTKHYQQAEELELDNPLGENLALLPILQAQKYRLVGEEEIDGVRCYRAAFDAGPEVVDGSVQDKLLHGVKGSGCFSVDGCHVVVFEMKTVRPLKEGPLRVDSLQLTFTGQAVERGWLLESVEMDSNVVVLGKRLRKLNSYRYSDFRYQPR